MPVEVALAPVKRGSLNVYPIEMAKEFGVDAFVTDRFGGVSDAPYAELNLAQHVGDDAARVNENRRRVAEACAVAPERLVTVRQVHGNRVLDLFDQAAEAEADGLITGSIELALAILVADCVPILLVDTASPRFGVVHAGWRGLAAGVLKNAVAHFASPHTLHAFIGPSISASAYQVGPEVAGHFTHVPAALVADVGDRYRLDLRAVSAHQLTTAGLVDEHIFTSRQFTDGGALFFSDRATRPCGRFALVAKRAS